ncbi:hypothetical protein GGI24_001425 [Coemansia furcata]|nr:hypothetical protein GGI24_001425 [Coemansia furcata]
MAHINDLPAAVLTRILFKATAISAETLSEWKANLPLVAVCRAWTELAQPFVFYHVYVELTSSPWSDILPFAYSNTRPFWTSNSELIISRRCILMTRHLTIELADTLPLECLQSIALDILRLDCVDWQHINALTVYGYSRVYQYSEYTTDSEEASDDDIARTVRHFGQNMRNVVELDLSYASGNPKCNYFCACLAATYGGQLQIHRAYNLLPVSFLNFSRHIKVLELNLGLLAYRAFPGICGETLNVLKLYDVPQNFAWHHFRYDTFDQPIVFRQLTILYLSYQPLSLGKAPTADEVQEKIALGKLNCDQLRFPALRKLTIINCTPDCDLLYTDTPFPGLKRMSLYGSIDSIRHCTRLKLTWVRRLNVNVSPISSDNPTETYGVTNHFLSNICIGCTASLCVNVDWFISDPDKMRWINLTRLLVKKEDYAAICKAIGRLSNLCKLDIFFLAFGDMAIDSLFADGPLFTSADPLLPWGDKLETVRITCFSEDSMLTAGVGGIQELILHAGALKKLLVPESAKQFVATFIDTHKDRFLHLANIKLLDE